MNSKKYLYNNLNKLVKVWPQIMLKCEYDDLCQGYYIEIAPSDFYHLLSDDINWIVFDFIQKYPFESIAFYKDGEVIEGNNKIKIFKGVLYNLMEKGNFVEFIDKINLTPELPKSFIEHNYRTNFNIVDLNLENFKSTKITFKYNSDIDKKVKEPIKNDSNLPLAA